MASDVDGLVERLRNAWKHSEVLCFEAADALIAERDARIAVESARDMMGNKWAEERDARVKAEQLAYDLKLAAAGGEDAPGAAHAVTVADVERWTKENWQRVTAAEAKLAQVEALANGRMSALIAAEDERSKAEARLAEAESDIIKAETLAIELEASLATATEALHKLVERADESDSASYGTMATTYVRNIARAALSSSEAGTVEHPDSVKQP